MSDPIAYVDIRLEEFAYGSRILEAIRAASDNKAIVEELWYNGDAATVSVDTGYAHPVVIIEPILHGKLRGHFMAGHQYDAIRVSNGPTRQTPNVGVINTVKEFAEKLEVELKVAVRS